MNILQCANPLSYWKKTEAEGSGSESSGSKASDSSGRKVRKKRTARGKVKTRASHGGGRKKGKSIRQRYIKFKDPDKNKKTLKLSSEYKDEDKGAYVFTEKFGRGRSKKERIYTYKPGSDTVSVKVADVKGSQKLNLIHDDSDSAIESDVETKKSGRKNSKALSKREIRFKDIDGKEKTLTLRKRHKNKDGSAFVFTEEIVKGRSKKERTYTYKVDSDTVSVKGAGVSSGKSKKLPLIADNSDSSSESDTEAESPRKTKGRKRKAAESSKSSKKRKKDDGSSAESSDEEQESEKKAKAKKLPYAGARHRLGYIGGRYF